MQRTPEGDASHGGPVGECEYSIWHFALLCKSIGRALRKRGGGLPLFTARGSGIDALSCPTGLQTGLHVPSRLGGDHAALNQIILLGPDYLQIERAVIAMLVERADVAH